MARFDVYKSKGGVAPPLLLQLQSELHDHLAGCVMAPLVPKHEAQGRSPERLMPCFEIDGKEYTMVTQEMASISKRFIGQKVTSLSNKHFEVTSAVDFLMQGF